VSQPAEGRRGGDPTEEKFRHLATFIPGWDNTGRLDPGPRSFRERRGPRFGSQFRKVLVGLDQIAWGMLFFLVAMAIRPRKAGLWPPAVPRLGRRLLAAGSPPGWAGRSRLRLRPGSGTRRSRCSGKWQPRAAASPSRRHTRVASFHFTTPSGQSRSPGSRGMTKRGAGACPNRGCRPGRGGCRPRSPGPPGGRLRTSRCGASGRTGCRW
jgi:hypothetical protein